MKALKKKDYEVLTMVSQGIPDMQVCRTLGILPEELDRILQQAGKLADVSECAGDVAILYERALRKRAENAARSLGARFNALLDASPEAVLVIHGTSGIIRQVNQRAADLFGYDASELVGRSMEDLVPRRLRAIHPAYRIGFLTSVRRREMGYHPPIFALRADGSEVEVTIALTASASDEEVMAVCSEFRHWTTEPASSKSRAEAG